MSIQEIEDLKQQYLDEIKRLNNSEHHDEIKIDELKRNFNRMSIEINKKEKLQQLEQVANLNTYPSKRFNYFCYDDDEDYTVVITPDFLLTDSFIMENEHLDTIPKTESDEFIKSSVENLVPIPSKKRKSQFLAPLPGRNSYVYDPNLNSFDCPPDSYHPPHPTYETYLCDSYGNDSHFGYDYLPQFPLNYESEPGYVENYNSYPYDSSSFSQQYLCCDKCEGPHETFQCQPMNQNFYNSNSPGFDQSQLSQFPVIQKPPQEMSIQEMEDLKQQYLDEMKRLINSEHRDEIKIDEHKGNFNRMSIEINKKEKLQQLKQVANLNTYPSKHFNYFCYDDDEDYTIVITPDFLFTDSLIIIKNEHLDTILETESDEFIKSSVDNLVPIPSESEDFSNIESEWDLPDCDVSQTTNSSTFSNPLFDDSTSSDDESSHEEVILEISFKTYSNPPFDIDEEIISSEFNPIHNEDLDSTSKNDRFDTKSYLL
nr:hypothetical protein [Tanacetum cinerariifolium]